MNTDPDNKRLFPRTLVRCPVVYRADGTDESAIGVSLDFSATGLRMFCKQAIHEGTDIQIELKPGDRKNIPEIVAQGQVVRCEPGRGGYYVSCRLLRVQPPKRESLGAASGEASELTE